MKRSNSHLFLVAFILFFVSSIIVTAAPLHQHDTQRALARQVLNATMADLALTPADTKIEDLGCNYGSSLSGDMCMIRMDYRPDIESENFTIFVHIWDSADLAYDDLFYDLEPKLKQPLEFHGYPAFYEEDTYGDTFANFQADQLMVDISAGWDAKKDAKAYLEIFYRNAITYGLIADNHSNPPTTVETPTPTPETGSPITLIAYADGYNDLTKTIDNTANFASIDIRGTLTDLNTGTAIAGATVEIISGASSASAQSTADGSYALTAIVPNGQDSGTTTGVDFALPIKADLTIEVTPDKSELTADGSSTSNITIQVRDSQGNPLKNRALSLDATADIGPGTLQPTQATTNDQGVIHATYTAFKLNPDFNPDDVRHEVSISASDNTTGLVGSASIFVSQYQMDIVFGEYIPACLRCDFPSKFSISVHDYWNNPIPNAPLTLRIEGGSFDGTLSSSPNSDEIQQEISLITDDNGLATAYYQWQGNVDITDATRRIAIIDNTTNAQSIKAVNIQGLDIAIAQIEEAGFTGVTGQQAFLKIYFKDRAHPNLPLDRFNVNDPNKLALRVSIGQYYSDGVNTSLTFDNVAGWGTDEIGNFVKMYTTPHMPYIIPMNDGTTWYEVQVNPVVDHDVYLPDLFRANNNTIIALTTGAPDNWLHIWLQDGVLTPHNWAGVVFKCVARFLPGLGNAITAIDTLNQTYNQDVLGLSQSTAQVLTDNLEKRIGKGSPQWLKKIDSTKAAALNNVVSCLQDTYGVYKTDNSSSQKIPDTRAICANLPGQLTENYLIPMPDKIDRQLLQRTIDQFVNGMLMDTPTQRAVLIYGLPSQSVVLRDATGQAIENSAGADAENNVVVYILPVEQNYTLQVSTDTPFDIGIYEAGASDETRKTYRHNVAPEGMLSATMAIGNASDNALRLDKNADGQIDDILPATTLIYDVVRPTIFDTQITQGSGAFGSTVDIHSNFADNPNGSGIDIAAVRVWIDDKNLSSMADINQSSLVLKSGDIPFGKHQLRIEVSDKDGNKTSTVQQFIFVGNLQSLFSQPILIVAILGAIALLLLLLLLSISLMRRSNSKSQSSALTHQYNATQDTQGRWWYQDPRTKEQYFWNGRAWQSTRSQPAPPPPHRHPAPNRIPPRKNSGCGSCLLVIIISGMLGVAVFGGVFLVHAGLINGFSLPQVGAFDTQGLLKAGGVGLFLIVIGLLVLNGGLKAIGNRRAHIDVGDEDYSDIREVSGCRAVVHGISQSFFGLILLIIGLLLMAFLLFQQILP